MQSIGIPGLILILIIALVIFGPSKLPQLGKAVGQTLKEFKSSARESLDEDDKKIETLNDTDTKK